MSRRRIKSPKKQGSEQKKESAKGSSQKRQEISFEELKSIVARAKELGLEEESLSKLDAAVDTLGVLTRELEAKGASILRLRRLIFGSSTEKTRNVLGAGKDEETADNETVDAAATASSEQAAEESDTVSGDTLSSQDAGAPQIEKPKRKGHGRRGASEYTGAKKCTVDHETLKHGASCPECEKGKLYRQKDPKVLVRVTGVAPIEAEVYELERLRCNLCGQVFTAKAPEGIGEEKYDTRAAAMIGLLKYGCGMPFNRLAKLEASLGIPLPASTQWELVLPAAEKMMPAFTEFIRRGAQGTVLHNDDTVGRILKLEGIKNGPYVIDDDDIDKKRTGIFTSGIVAIDDGRRIALFFTSRKHAGENLETVLKERAAELGPPIQMSDGLSRNTKGVFETIETECNCHARRKYVEVVNSFPEEVAFVLNQYKIVYKHDDETKKLGMSDEERLAYHQEHSGPIMTALENQLNSYIAEHQVEPNSALGDAIGYTLDHWEKLTMFLKVPGAPLDNNICERAMKKAILHRKNAYFFRTKNGAFVGDLFMTLIHTTELNDENPFEYLVALLDNAGHLARNPAQWMPWNFRETLTSLEANKNL